MNSKQISSAEKNCCTESCHRADSASFAIDGLDDPAELNGEADRAWREAMGRRLRERLNREGVTFDEESSHAMD